MNQAAMQVRFYSGCETNKGIFVGFDSENVFVRDAASDRAPAAYPLAAWGKELFLLLRPMSSMTDEERQELISKGCNIGRPKGYSFSVDAFLYLLDLRMDLFGLIRAGYARPVEDIP